MIVATLWNSASPIPFVLRTVTANKSRIKVHINFVLAHQVLATKDWTKWDWDVVDDIVQDILPHAPRLVDALRTKWVKRVSGFYRFVGAGPVGTSTDR